MSDRNAWGQMVDKGEDGTMRAQEIERREAMRRQQEEADRQAREHQRRMEAQQERQRQLDRRTHTRHPKTPAKPLPNKRMKSASPKTAGTKTASIGKLALFLAVVGAIVAYNDPQLRSDALKIAFFILATSFIGLHILNYALKTVFILVKWAAVVIGIVSVFHVIAAVLGSA